MVLSVRCRNDYSSLSGVLRMQVRSNAVQTTSSQLQDPFTASALPLLHATQLSLNLTANRPCRLTSTLSRATGTTGHARAPRQTIGTSGSQVHRKLSTLMTGRERCIERSGNRWRPRFERERGSIGRGRTIARDTCILIFAMDSTCGLAIWKVIRDASSPRTTAGGGCERVRSQDYIVLVL